MGLGPPKVMKSTFCSATTLLWKHRPPLCHLDRSAAQWRDLRFSGPFLEMFFGFRIHYEEGLSLMLD